MTSEQEAEAKRWIERLAIHLDSATDILEVEIDEPDDIAEERCFIANAREFLASLAAPPAGVGAEAHGCRGRCNEHGKQCRVARPHDGRCVCGRCP